MRNKGAVFGLISGFTWALDTVLIGMVLSSTVFNSTAQILFLAPLLSTFFHDAFSSIWMMVYLGLKGDLKQSILKVKTRSGRFAMLGGLLGGPIGMTFYVLAVQYMGASYAASMSAVYPAVGAFFAFLLLKDRLTVKNWIGLFISMLFIFLLGYSSGGISENFTLGFIFILICIFGWGMECVVLAYGMKDNEISPEQALQIRQLVSAITYGLLIIPLFGGYSIMPNILNSSEFFFIALIALSGTASYVYYYKAIYTIGPTRAMALNITYSAWSIILSFLLLDQPLSIKLILCSVMILIGSVITVATPDELSIKGVFKDRRIS